MENSTDGRARGSKSRYAIDIEPIELENMDNRSYHEGRKSHPNTPSPKKEQGGPEGSGSRWNSGKLTPNGGGSFFFQKYSGDEFEKGHVNNDNDSPESQITDDENDYSAMNIATRSRSTSNTDIFKSPSITEIRSRVDRSLSQTAEGLNSTYRRFITPLASPDTTDSRNASGKNPYTALNVDERGFVKSTSGVSLLAILEGTVRIPKDRSKMIVQQSAADLGILDDWEYPGWGSVIEKTMKHEEMQGLHHHHDHPQLDVARSTAIAGNDLLASVLYTTGIVCGACGQLTPIAMFFSCMCLYPFRKIFQECGTALPLNGGVYVAMLNSGSKFTATFAASCSLISYSATAVVSAASCTTYAAGEWGDFPQIPVTISILVAFAILVLFGVKDSANVALAIFSFHLLTITVLVIVSFVYIFQTGGGAWVDNWHSPLPISSSGGVGMDLYMGYSVALLGLTGFETSANYIEEAGPFETEKNKVGPTRKISVFEKTIDRMWWLVIIVNPAIAIATLGVCDLETISSNVANILSVVGGKAGGPWLRTFVSIDALIVLCGGVLTAFVGVTGLIRQLSADRCLPSFLLTTNRFGTPHWIILSFLILCTTLYTITNGDVIVLSGVFSIAFLMVLLSFAVANMKLKFCRPRLPRGAHISWTGCLFGFTAMLIGFLGNVIYNPQLVVYFLIYLTFYFGVILMTFQRMRIMKLLLYICRQVPLLNRNFSNYLCASLKEMKKHTVVFFTKTSELHILNKAVLYARDNELCDRLIITHVYNPNDITANSNDEPASGSRADLGGVPARLRENLSLLDHMYPKTKIDILLVCAEEFNPDLVLKLSKDLNILPSFMFIRCPGEGFRYNIGEFGGVRTIMQ